MDIDWDSFKIFDLINFAHNQHNDLENCYKELYQEYIESEQALINQLNEEQNKLFRNIQHETINARDEARMEQTNFMLKYGFVLGMEIQKFIDELES